MIAIKEITKSSLTYYGAIVLLAFLFMLRNASATDITEYFWVYDSSLNVNLGLPVLQCHSKQMGYSKVLWYKDGYLIREGGSDPADHLINLQDLLDDETNEQFEHPLKLQGYYTCETDRMNFTAVHSYLFRMREIHTFAGKFVSTRDSMGSDSELSLKDKMILKKTAYENEMQEVMFGFLPKPNTFVTDINIIETGLEVRFYLYARQLVNPRQPYAGELIADQHELKSIFEYLDNKTIDDSFYQEIVDWTDLRGIHIEDIILRSTLGCYQEESMVTADPPQEVTWPYAHIGEVVIPTEGCSSNNGLAVTRLCSGSFHSGARWGIPSGKCDKRPTKLTAQLKGLYDSFGDDPKPIYIEKLQKLTSNSEMLTVTDLQIIIDILTELSEIENLKVNEMDAMFTVIDHLVTANRSQLQAAISTIKLTNRLLRIIDRILTMSFLEKEEYIITKNHILVEIKNTQEKEDHVVGLAIKSSATGKESLGNSSIHFLLEGSSILKEDILAYFLLPKELVANRERETASELKTQVSVVFFEDWLLFPNPKYVLYKRNYKVLPSPVMYVSITGGHAWNLTNGVHLYFRNEYGNKIENPVCVQFDPRMEDGEGAWNYEGCEYGGIQDGFYSCVCHHLSIFAVILSERPDTVSPSRLRLGTAIYVGCAASFIALSFTVVLYMLSNVWRKTVDHSILFWIAVSLLCFIILLFISELRFARKPGCRFIAMLLHYTVLVIAMWLLAQAVMHRLRFANKTDMEEVPHFVLKSAICCWGIPVVIMIIIWLTKDYRYKQDSCWRALSDVSRWTLIPIGVILFITLWLNVCAVYAVTCRFKRDYMIGNLGYDESVLKFRVAVTIYFFVLMSYLFGFFALHNKTRELRILFSISITLTAYYVTLFFVFQEVSLWEMCAKWKKRQKKKAEGETVKFVADKEKYTVEKPPQNDF